MIRIDRATVHDLPLVLELLQTSGLPEAGLSRHVDTLLVAREDGRIVGCAGIELYGNAGLLRSVAVAPDIRTRGLGTRLTHAALELAGDRGVTEVFLLTETAERFFATLNFTTVLRDNVPAAVQASIEFAEACPASAMAMKFEI